jgi:hypothetical protein
MLSRFFPALPHFSLHQALTFVVFVGIVSAGFFAAFVLPIVGPEKFQTAVANATDLNKIAQSIEQVIPIGPSEPTNPIPTGPYCGDASCDEGESLDTCALDCFACNANGKCDVEIGENSHSCPTDCRPVTTAICDNDGICALRETTYSCPNDCPLEPIDPTPTDTNQLITQTCGNNSTEGTEICDGTALNSNTCITQGFASGTITCNSACTGFVTTACTGAPTQTCGNNIREGTETCDTNALSSQTCASRGYASGTLGCSSTCDGFNTSACQYAPGTTYFVCDCQEGASAGCVAGNDSNPGTSAASPWRTYDKARTAFKNGAAQLIHAGDAIAFCRGGSFRPTDTQTEWVNSTCTADNPCVLRDYVPSGGDLNSPQPLLTFTSSTGNLYGFSFENSGGTAHEEGYTLLNLHIKGASSTTGRRWGINVANDLDDLILDHLTIEGFANGVNIGGSSGTIYPGSDGRNSRITLRNSRIINNSGQGWIGSADGAVIENNYFGNNGFGAVDILLANRLHNVYYSSSAATESTIIRGNELYQSTMTDMDGDGDRECAGASLVVHGHHNNMVIESNYIHEDLGAAHGGCWGIAVDPSSSTADGAFDNLVIRRNRLENMGNLGIGCTSCTNSVIENNLIIQEQSFGTIGIGIPTKSRSDVGAGSAITSNVSVRNNSLYFGSSALHQGVIIGGEGTGYIVANNAILFTGTNSALNCFSFTLPLSSYQAINHNACFFPNAPSAEWENASGISPSALNAWQAASGFDSNSLNANPLFRSTTGASYDLSLSAGSLLACGGSAALGSATDFSGVARKNPPTIGAYESTDCAGGTSPTHSIVSSAGTGGAISPAGSISVMNGLDQSFVIASNPGYQVAQVRVDGTDMGAVNSYVFSNVTADHTISAAFTLISPPPNQAPAVNAGPDQTVTLPSTATLAPTVSDDGLPSSTLSYAWTQISGPQSAVFGSPTAKNSTVTFPVSGTYILRLSVSDGAASATDDLTITVQDPAQSAVGLIGYYPLNNDATDQSGNALNGTLIGNPGFSAGKYGQAIVFGGSGAQRVNLGTSSAFADIETQGGGGFTVLAWIYPVTLGEYSEGTLLNKNNISTSTNGAWDLYLKPNSSFAFEKSFNPTGLRRQSNSNSITLNQWQQVAVSWDGSENASNVHLYLNGTETGYYATINGTGTKISDAANPLSINDGTGNREFNGMIDDVRIYNRVLSASEIQAVYTQGPGS